MEITLQRLWLGDKATIGLLSVDGAPECFTLEDAVRERHRVPVKEWKIDGETAIPRGRYRVAMTRSPKFKRELPELFGVPGFTHVRIHMGNRDKDTTGCILVGCGCDRSGILYRSMAALGALMGRMEAAMQRGEAVWITIQ